MLPRGDGVGGSEPLGSGVLLTDAVRSDTATRRARPLLPSAFGSVAHGNLWRLAALDFTRTVVERVAGVVVFSLRLTSDHALVLVELQVVA